MSRIDIELKTYAESLGFTATVDQKGFHQPDVPNNPWSFVKGAVTIWYVGSNRSSVSLPKEAQHGDWMAAELIDDSFCNHRAYDGLKAALDAEFARQYTVTDMRSDIKAKLIAEDAKSLDDDELQRVFTGVALEQFCIREAQKARAAGITMEDITLDVIRSN